MHFQWYPGHMTKAKRAMQEDIKLIDVIIELVDARIPRSSKNPDIDSLAQGKSRILLLNKSDMADAAKTQAWISYYEKQLGRENLYIYFDGTDQVIPEFQLKKEK